MERPELARRAFLQQLWPKRKGKEIMSGEFAVSLALKLNDQGSGPATQALAKINKGMKEVGETAKSASTAAISAFQKLATSREILGIRSEKAIQNEIRQTEAAYQRMVASGQAGARELGRAQDAMKQKVSALRHEMEGVKNTAGGMGRTLGVAMGVVGAYQAGKMVLSGPVGQTMAYDRVRAYLSNTAFAGQSLDARRVGMRTLDAGVIASVRTGGGTREAALGTLDKMVGSNAYSDVSEATGLLPTILKHATAANADPTQLADIAIRAKQIFKLKDTGLALDQAMKAGQMGGFELKDMAKWLPQQMAMGSMSGLKGDDGYRTLLALNQAAAITAGTKDEAGNNVVNLLGKINSQDTAKDFEKIKINGKGIDLPGSLAAARAKGVNSVDAFSNLVEQVLLQDKGYVELRKKAASATGDEQKDIYESMADIGMGKGMGKTTQDRQALMALIAAMQFKDYRNDIYAGTDASKARGTGDDAFDLIAETPSFKAEQFAAERAIAMQEALDKVNPLLGGMAEGLTGLIRDYPTLGAALSGTTLATNAMTAAATAASVALMLVARSGGAGALPGVAGTVGRVLPFLGKATGFLGVLGAGYAAGSFADEYFGINEGINKGVSAFTGRDETLGGLIYEMTHGDAIKQNNSTTPSGGGMSYQATQQPLRVAVDVNVQNGNIVASVNEANSRNASRH